MGRSIRIQLFVDEEEMEVFRLASPVDERLSASVRRMALDRARWLVNHGRKQRGKSRVELQRDSGEDVDVVGGARVPGDYEYVSDYQ